MINASIGVKNYGGTSVCEIYADVDGVFTADPEIVPEA